MCDSVLINSCLIINIHNTLRNTMHNSVFSTFLSIKTCMHISLHANIVLHSTYSEPQRYYVNPLPHQSLSSLGIRWSRDEHEKWGVETSQLTLALRVCMSAHMHKSWRTRLSGQIYCGDPRHRWAFMIPVDFTHAGVDITCSIKDTKVIATHASDEYY